jgi:methyl-accepting chemotaxis protein
MFKFINKLTLSTKLIVTILWLVNVSVIVLGIVLYMATVDGLYKSGEISMKATSDAVYNAMNLKSSSIKRQLRVDITRFEKEIEMLGGISFTDQQISVNAVDQVSKMPTKVNIPVMKIGSIDVYQNKTIVDNLKDTNNGESNATIFQVIPNGLLRISTNVIKSDGDRATGTYIPSSSPVYKSVMSGMTFEGRANVVGNLCATIYKPLMDNTGKVVAVIYSGEQILSPTTVDYIESVKLGTGYFFIYDEAGIFKVHPTLVGKSLYDNAPEFKGVNDTFVNYVWSGNKKMAYTKFIDSWGLYIAVGLNEEEILHGIDKEVLKNGIIVAVILMIGALLTNILLVKYIITPPIKELSEKSKLVGDGDYTVKCDVLANDEIGTLANAFNGLTDKGGSMISDIKELANNLSEHATDLSTVSEQMNSNASQTSEQANNASIRSTETSENMIAIASAMEESTTNINMIASATEEMTATINEISESSSKASSVTQDAVEKAKSSMDRVNHLGDKAESVGKIVETIKEISEQTNLLALNATIESARAGEKGRGFAVVASEIKDSIDEIQSATKLTIEEINSIGNTITEINEIVYTIVTAIEEQSATTQEIGQSVSQASIGLSEINENVSTASVSVNEIAQDVNSVSEASNDVKDGSITVKTASTKLSELSDKLMELVSVYKV